MAITLREQYLEGFVSPHEMDCMAPQVAAAVCQLRQHTGAGSDFHGWLTLPRDYDNEELARIHAAAEKIRSDTDVLVVIGIGWAPAAPSSCCAAPITMLWGKMARPSTLRGAIFLAAIWMRSWRCATRSSRSRTGCMIWPSCRRCRTRPSARSTTAGWRTTTNESTVPDIQEGEMI